MIFNVLGGRMLTDERGMLDLGGGRFAALWAEWQGLSQL